jgi:hypothetical protein
VDFQTGSRWETRVCTCLTALLTAALGFCAPAAAETDQGSTVRRTVKVDAHYTEPPGEVKVDCGLAGEPACFAGYAYFTGTFVGEAYYELAGPPPDSQGNVIYEGAERVTGSIRGCGKGSFILDITEGKIYTTRFDAATQSAPGYNRWSVRRGSGTGGLAGLVSGSGENHWRMFAVAPDPAAPRFGEGDFTGQVTCRVRKARRPAARRTKCKGRVAAARRNGGVRARGGCHRSAPRGRHARSA